MRTKTSLAILSVAVVVAACAVGLIGACSDKTGSEEGAPVGMTAAARDSAIAESGLPGAGVVGKALSVADSAQARARRMDDTGDE
jgi:hypothetical protein